jgi:hypothetical protein
MFRQIIRCYTVMGIQGNVVWNCYSIRRKISENNFAVENYKRKAIMLIENYLPPIRMIYLNQYIRNYYFFFFCHPIPSAEKGIPKIIGIKQ